MHGNGPVTARSPYGRCTVHAWCDTSTLRYCGLHGNALVASNRARVVICTAKSSMPQRSSGRPRLEIDVEQVQELLNQRFTLQEAAEQLKVLENSTLSTGIALSSIHLLQA